MGDAFDVLGVQKMPSTPSDKIRAIMKTPTSSTRKLRTPSTKEVRLLAENARITLTPVSKNLQFKEKRQLKEPVKPWVYKEFSAKNKGALLHHWERAEDINKESPFKELCKKIRVFKYTDAEYNHYLTELNNDESPRWTKQETDELFSLCEQFDLRFLLIHDRLSFSHKSVEQLKRRYYTVCQRLLQVRGKSKHKEDLARRHPIMQTMYQYDQATSRQKAMEHYWSRPLTYDIQEQNLKEKLRQIEAIKRKREEELRQQTQKKKKTPGRKKKKLHEEKRAVKEVEEIIEEPSQVASAYDTTPKPVSNQEHITERGPPATIGATTTIPQPTVVIQLATQLPAPPPEPVDSKLYETCVNCGRQPGPILRSQLMKLPSTKIHKRIELVLQNLSKVNINVPLNPVPTREVHVAYEELRSKAVVESELQRSVLKKELKNQHSQELQQPLASQSTIAQQGEQQVETAEGRRKTSGAASRKRKDDDRSGGTPKRKKKD